VNAGADRTQIPHDIEFEASVRAANLRFRRVPKSDIRFSGAPGHESMTTMRRTNLADPVAEDVDYENPRVDYRFKNSVATRLEEDPGRDLRYGRRNHG
jgi:hypothetical protein